MDWPDFHEWNKKAVEKRDDCHVEDLSYKDFLKWIDETSRQRR